MFADMSTVGIWLRIDRNFRHGYGVRYSFDWWTLNLGCSAQVTPFQIQAYKHILRIKLCVGILCTVWYCRLLPFAPPT